MGCAEGRSPFAGSVNSRGQPAHFAFCVPKETGVMRFIPWAAMLAFVFVLSDCTGSSTATERDPDAATLENMSELAIMRAREIAPDAVLRQLGLAGPNSKVTFRLTDIALTQAISLTADMLGPSPVPFELVLNDVSPLLCCQHPGISLRFLQVGPAAVIKTASRHWQDCQPRGLTLSGRDDDLVWYIFCNVPEGVVSGTVDGSTGAFTPSLAPPARPPAIATAVPGGK